MQSYAQFNRAEAELCCPPPALWLFALIDRKPLKMCNLMPVPPLSGKNVWLGVLRNVTAGRNSIR